MNGILLDKTDVIKEMLTTQLEYTSPESILVNNLNLLKFTTADMGIVDSIYSYFACWGYYLMLVMFFTHIVNIMTKDNFTFEMLMKEFIKLAAGIVLIESGPLLIGYFVSLGNAAVTAVNKIGQTALTGANGQITNYKQYIDQIAETANIFDWLGLMLSGSLLFWICNILATAIKVQFITRKVEMLVRLSLTPISFQDIANGEFDKTGAVKYLKKIFALSIQGCAIVTVFYCVESVIMSSAPVSLSADAGTFESTAFLTTSIVGLLCCVGATSVTKQIVNDVFDVK